MSLPCRSSQAAIDTFVSAGNSYVGYHDMLILDSALPTAAWAAMNAVSGSKRFVRSYRVLNVHC